VVEAIDAARALEVLLSLTRRLADQRPLHEALGLVTDAALELLPGDHASIRVLDASGGELLSGARSGIGVSTRPLRHERGRGVGGWVVDHGAVARIDEVTADPRFVPRSDQGFAIRSMLAVPLWSGGKVIGVLALSSPEPARFAEPHEQLTSLLANCAVPPIEKARLARLAVTDAHTMAFNHAYLLPGLEREMSEVGEPGALSLLLMDLDRFKLVNDEHGHAAGDRVLRIFADRVRASTRSVDQLVRRGGDEFVLIMPGADRESALGIAQRIRTTMADDPIALDGGHKVEVRVSVGVATWDGHESAADLERRADEAMYSVKQAGRDGVRYYDDERGPISIRNL
jgi:two-component system, cell cycle response regulator